MSLKFGLAVMNDFPPDVVPADRIAALREQVRAARDAGISSVWVLQHYLGNMPTLQPVPLLAALARDAGEMALGTNMFILPLRHPVEVAEEFATLDHITGGRAVAGFGMGYRENEFASFGVALEDRIQRYEEGVGLIRSLWSGEPTTFEGKHFRVEDQRIGLEPVQQGGPPIWVGAGPHRTGAHRAARLGDAWIVPPHVTPERLEAVLGHYRAERERLGRGASELVVRRELVLDEDAERARAIGIRARGALTRRYAAFNPPEQGGNYRHLETDKAAEEVADASYLFTDPAGAVAALKELERRGLTYVILRMQWYDLGQEQVLRTLETFRNEVLPAFR
ncbi:alkanesulfonate monooxygenase SsuD/methylene tetrahydromethanopterin reductase-like flavin-dependent oxidoreductase (luciferase family) [Spinactinospora alkalitolerans]|uniref:Alkanesulfonate monooxygenase SsuD/methylene tetrahydromethanopterin reductase-like flavin-dependent oxidoreductase (Luciferase family) n=1 Tax=Spinactinospora alkalitolerans TaxID=687207 RepID=A0A852TY27_9ACTN|nr:LLM class flavin-dependent oxidoreductase [Spinactinospora alkalitolerans]NYE47713.1 alkanesulfonate monooxygenase SsuD/methylene tetrahydromethanopterin reductase-like flavin-dependent oxidoreductase (luciferase family) [Spinactinospora alkalitolerans]